MKTNQPKDYHLFRMMGAGTGIPPVKIGDFRSWEEAETAREETRSRLPGHCEITVCRVAG